MLTRTPIAANPIDRLASSTLSIGTGLFSRHAAAIGASLFGLYLLLVSLTVVVLPDSNWDMLAYLAVAEESSFDTPAALHDYVYSAVKAEVSDSDYRALTEDGGYRSHMASDPAAFHSMLSMYRVKFLYAETLSALSKIMSPIAAMHAVQIFSVLLFGGLVLLWLRSMRLLALAPVFAALLMVSDFASIARASSPDLLGAALLIGGLLAYVRRSEILTAALIFLAVMVRPDNVVFVGVFAVLLLAFRQRSLGVIAAALASFAGYIAISRWAGHPGWWPHLYFSSVQQQLSMDGFDPPFSIAAYLKAFGNAAVRALTFNSWVGVAVLALAGWFVTDRAGFRLDRRAGVLFAALVLAVLAKFVVFPIHDTRIYFPNLIAPFLLLALPFASLFASLGRGGHHPAVKRQGDIS